MPSDVPTFVYVNEGDEPSPAAALDVVFVHGLTGDQFKSWGDSAEQFWPHWLAVDFRNCNVYSASYDSALFVSLITGPGSSIQDIAGSLAAGLLARKNRAASILFITHSLGGLVIKQLIRRCSDSADPELNELARSIRGVVFLGTPHQGAGLASALNSILHGAKSTVVKQLAYSHDTLIDLHEFFRAWAVKSGVPIKAFYETRYTWGVHVVDKVTANPNVPGADPIAVDVDHVAICKPEGRHSLVYATVSKMIGDIMAGNCRLAPLLPVSTVAVCGNQADDAGEGASPCSLPTPVSSTSADSLDADIAADFELFTTHAPDDRRDLAQKLNDAGRAYQIREAERMKERFNMALQRNIAQPSAVTRYTRLMADVESRFNRHVARLISGDASPEQIDRTIQSEVIDACSNIHSVAGNEVSASLIDGALYYLGGNCHLRWDND